MINGNHFRQKDRCVTMTTPPHGRSSDDDDQDNNNPSQQPYYPPSDHPEDRSDFGYQGAEQAAYGVYGDPSENSGRHAAGDYSQSEVNPGVAKGTGKIDILAAVSWGFSTTFRNAKLWILLGLIGLLAIIGSAAISFGVLAVTTDLDAVNEQELQSFGGANAASSMVGLAIALISLVLTPYVYRLGLFQVDDPATGWGHLWKDTPLLRTLGVLIVAAIVSGIVYLLTMVPLNQALEDLVDPDRSVSASAVLFMVLGFVVMLIWSVLSMFMAWAAASGQFGFGESLKTGWNIGKGNFGRLLLFVIAFQLIAPIAILLTFLLGIVVIFPAYTLMVAHMFRQAVGTAPH